MSLDLLSKMTIRAQQRNESCAASYKEALRDAEEFWRLWHSISDDIPQKKDFQKRYLEIMNFPDD